MDDEHKGTLQQASSGWYYVECSCYWRSRREQLGRSAWWHHERHIEMEAQVKAIRRQIGTDG